MLTVKGSWLSEMEKNAGYGCGFLVWSACFGLYPLERDDLVVLIDVGLLILGTISCRSDFLIVLCDSVFNFNGSVLTS